MKIFRLFRLFRLFHLFTKLINGEATSKDKISLVLRIVGLLSAIGTLVLTLITWISALLALLMFSRANSINTSWSSPHQNLPPEVLRWQPYVEATAGVHEIPHAVNYLLIIIMLESGGRAEEIPDIMQASESLGLPPNTITDPFESIEAGVAYFAQAYRQFPNHDLLNILQAYNFGIGFLNYTAYAYEFTTAVAFARNLSGGRRVSYLNPLAVATNGGWRYAYGIALPFITKNSHNV